MLCCAVIGSTGSAHRPSSNNSKSSNSRNSRNKGNNKGNNKRLRGAVVGRLLATGTAAFTGLLLHVDILALEPYLCPPRPQPHLHLDDRGRPKLHARVQHARQTGCKLGAADLSMMGLPRGRGHGRGPGGGVGHHRTATRDGAWCMAAVAWHVARGNGAVTIDAMGVDQAMDGGGDGCLAQSPAGRTWRSAR